MKRIFKYRINTEPGAPSEDGVMYSRVDMPKGAKILSVDVQQGEPVLWALVDPEAPKERRTIWTPLTGQEVPDGFSGRTFIGTVQTMGDNSVLHVWE